MYVEVDKEDPKKLAAYADESDQCYKCACVFVCPLLRALTDETVILKYEQTQVVKCELFIENPEEEHKNSFGTGGGRF